MVIWKITSKSIGTALAVTSFSGSSSEGVTGGGGLVDASSSSGFLMYSTASTITCS